MEKEINGWICGIKLEDPSGDTFYGVAQRTLYLPKPPDELVIGARA